MQSLPVLFSVSREENMPSRFVCEVSSHTRFIKQVQNPFPFPKSVQMPNEDAHTTISVLVLSNVSRSQGITHAHNNLQISEHCRCQTDYYKITKRKRLLVIQIKDTKSDSGQFGSGKRLADWRKHEEKQIHTRKPKT